LATSKASFLLGSHHAAQMGYGGRGKMLAWPGKDQQTSKGGAEKGKSKGKGKGAVDPEVVLQGPREPCWSCWDCGADKNWASRIVCKHCPKRAPEATRKKAFIEHAKAIAEAKDGWKIQGGKGGKGKPGTAPAAGDPAAAEEKAKLEKELALEELDLDTFTRRKFVESAAEAKIRVADLKGQLASLAGKDKTTTKSLGNALFKAKQADEKTAKLAKEIEDGKAWLEAKVADHEAAVENAKALKAEVVDIRALLAAQPFGEEDEGGQAMAAACSAIAAAAGQLKVPGAASELAAVVQTLQCLVEKLGSENARKLETQMDDTCAEESAAEIAEAAWQAAKAEKQADADERKQELDAQAFADSMAAADNALRSKFAAIAGDTGAAAMGEALNAHKEQRTAAEAEAKRRRQNL
jgi:hypothetical protein